MRKIFVTGGTGFAGKYLVNNLSLNKNYDVKYTSLSQESENCYKIDITNKKQVEQIINEFQPEIIFHLAASSSVSESFKDPKNTFKTNTIGTLNILESFSKTNDKNKFIYISSGEVYGGGELLKEDSEIKLKSPYASSKYVSELICQNYSDNMDITILRPFTHTGPYQESKFVISSIAKQIAEIKNFNKPEIKLGNLEIKRDFMDVRDIVNAYEQAMNCPSGIYNISNGNPISLNQVIKTFQSISSKNFDVTIDSSKIRDNDIPILSGDASKFMNITKWRPEIPFSKTARDMIEYWEQIKKTT